MPCVRCIRVRPISASGRHLRGARGPLQLGAGPGPGQLRPGRDAPMMGPIPFPRDLPANGDWRSHPRFARVAGIVPIPVPDLPEPQS